MCDYPTNFTKTEEKSQSISKKEIRSRMLEIIQDQITISLKNLFLTILFVCGLACIASSILIFIIGNANQHVALLVHIGSVIAIIGGLGYWLYKVYLQAKSGE